MLYQLKLKIKQLISVVQSKEADYNTKITEIKKQLTDHDHDKYITTTEFNYLAARVFTSGLTQENLVAKTDFMTN